MHNDKHNAGKKKFVNPDLPKSEDAGRRGVADAWRERLGLGIWRRLDSLRGLG